MIKLWRDSNRRPSTSCVATVGTFDGLHVGHQHIIKRVVAIAKHVNMPAVVILFEPQPKEYLLGDVAPLRLMKLTDKIRRLEQLGVNEVVCLRFNEMLAKKNAHGFVAELLCEKLAVKRLVVGHDVCFGHDRIRAIDSLRAYGAPYGLEIEVESPLLIDNERVSSTEVRRYLKQGNFLKVNKLLGCPLSISGRVCYGQSRGRQFGFPTANLAIHQKMARLLCGVYRVKIVGISSNDRVHMGVANIGIRPTLYSSGQAWLEVHVFDWEGGLYGKRLVISLIDKIRSERRFLSVEALIDQIRQDIVEAKARFHQDS